jgi:hypothetical protein
MANATGGGNLVRDLFVSLAGECGSEFADISTITIRNVVKGILGGGYHSGFIGRHGLYDRWGTGCRAMGLYMLIFNNHSNRNCTGCHTRYHLHVLQCKHFNCRIADGLAYFGHVIGQFLKADSLGRGAPVPMLVIFLVSIGGFISMGFIGLFVGAVILSLGFKLLQAWLKVNSNDKITVLRSEAFPHENSEAEGH